MPTEWHVLNWRGLKSSPGWPREALNAPSKRRLLSTGARITGARHRGLPLPGSANCSPDLSLSSKAHAKLRKVCLSPAEADEAPAPACRTIRGSAFRSGAAAGESCAGSETVTNQSEGVCSTGGHSQPGWRGDGEGTDASAGRKARLCIPSRLVHKVIKG